MNRLSGIALLALMALCGMVSVRPRSAPAVPVASASVETVKAPADDWWQPTNSQPIHWHWQLSDEFVFPRDVLPGVTVYNLDGELTTAETIAQLHALSPQVRVICYIDAGVYESYRSDAGSFPPEVIGEPVEGWEESWWLDVRQSEVLLPIMQERMEQWCAGKGFDAVEPDDTEVWTNPSGFPITKAQNHAYTQQIAALAHSLGLSVGLKNNTAEASELEPFFDWALNEQCWRYEECEVLRDSFLAKGKAVFNIEYETEPDCALANAWQMNAARRDLDLAGPTNPEYFYEPCIPDTQDAWAAGQ
jgi:hypothetical protein